MMFKLSLISLFLLFVGYTLGDPTTSSSMTVANTMMSLSSKATSDSKTIPNHQTTLIPTISPNPKPTSHSNPTTTLKAPDSKPTSHSNPTTTLKAPDSKPTSHSNPTTTLKAPDSKPTSHLNPTTTLKAPDSKPTSHLNPKTTLKAAVTMKIATTMNTIMKNDGTTLNPRDNIHFLFYVVFLLLCVH